MYHVTVYVHPDTFDTSCNCPAYARFLECKHGVAVLFALCGEDLKEEFFSSTMIARKKHIYQPAEQFINLFGFGAKIVGL
ncbi:SWIM zinc finger family protein [Bacillus thuringiensis]